MVGLLDLDKLIVPPQENPEVRKAQIAQQVQDLRRKVVNGESVSREELREATAALRKYREIQEYSAPGKSKGKAKVPAKKLTLADL